MLLYCGIESPPIAPYINPVTRNPVYFSGAKTRDSETGFLFLLPQLTVIFTTETRFLSSVSKTRNSETGFLFWRQKLTVIFTTETRFLFWGKNQGLRNRVSFLPTTVNCDIHNRNPVSFLGQIGLLPIFYSGWQNRPVTRSYSSSSNHIRLSS